MILKKGDKIRVKDDMIFPDKIYKGCIGWVTEKEQSKTGVTKIAFYPNGKRLDFDIDNVTSIGDYLERA